MEILSDITFRSWFMRSFGDVQPFNKKIKKQLRLLKNNKRCNTPLTDASWGLCLSLQVSSVANHWPCQDWPRHRDQRWTREALERELQEITKVRGTSLSFNSLNGFKKIYIYGQTIPLTEFTSVTYHRGKITPWNVGSLTFLQLMLINRRLDKVPYYRSLWKMALLPIYVGCIWGLLYLP